MIHSYRATFSPDASALLLCGLAATNHSAPEQLYHLTVLVYFKQACAPSKVATHDLD